MPPPIEAILKGNFDIIDSLKAIIDKIRLVNPDKVIEIYLADLNLIEEQLLHVQFEFKDYSNVYTYVTCASFYNKNFSDEFLDIVIGVSCFGYMEMLGNDIHYPTAVYMTPFDFNEAVDRVQDEFMWKILKLVSLELKKGGLFINIDFACSDSNVEKLRPHSKYYHGIVACVLETLKGKGKLLDFPIVQRNTETIMNCLKKNNDTNFSHYFSEDLMDEHCYSKYLKTGDFPIIQTAVKNMNLSCCPIKMYEGFENEKNQCSETAMENLLKMGTFEEIGLVTGIPGVLCSLLKK